MNRWVEPQPVTLPDGFQAQLGVSELVARVLVERGLNTVSSAKAFLDPLYYTPTSPGELPGVEVAAEKISEHLEARHSFLVWGDFDVDGQTATTILVSALRQLGAAVNFYIPVRERESHGIHIEPLRERIPGINVLLTCDTGVAAHEAIEYANRHGITTIVTDHHDLLSTLPSAQVVVSPKLLPKGHPLATLSGVGVAYKLVEALFDIYDLDPSQFLDLVALGMVADIAKLVGDARYLVQRGIEYLRKTHRAGLIALYETAEINPETITAEQISYGLAPRLNALGRLADANKIVDFLTTSDRTLARITASELEALNARRKFLTDQIFEAALAQIERDRTLLDKAAIVLDHPTWESSVIGIVASRLVDFFHKPVILIAQGKDGKARGSARSIPGVNITQALADQSNLLEGYGGHPMAGGFAIRNENIQAFRKGLVESVSKQIQSLPTSGGLEISAWVELEDLTEELAEELYQLAPFGAGNPPILLAAKELRIVRYQKIGRYGEHLRITIADRLDRQMEVLWWQGAGLALPESTFDLAFTILPSNYQGRPGIEVEWVEARSVATDSIPIPKLEFTLTDLRHVEDPIQEIRQFIHEPDHVIWCEGQPGPVGNSFDRYRLRQSKRLIVWTIPPSRHELIQALAKVKPEEVVLFAIDPHLDEMIAFLTRLAGVLKSWLKHSDGKGKIAVLASETAHSEITVQVAVQWLCARGDLALLEFDGETYHLKPGNRIRQPETPVIEKQLKLLLEEASAFRKYYRDGDLKQLIL